MSEIEFYWCRYDEDDNETECEVHATFHGKFIPARMYPTDDAHPAEHPDLEFDVYDPGNKRITDSLTKLEEEQITDLCWQKYDSVREDDYHDY